MSGRGNCLQLRPRRLLWLPASPPCSAHELCSFAHGLRPMKSSSHDPVCLQLRPRRLLWLPASPPCSAHELCSFAHGLRPMKSSSHDPVCLQPDHERMISHGSCLLYIVSLIFAIVASDFRPVPSSWYIFSVFPALLLFWWQALWRGISRW